MPDEPPPGDLTERADRADRADVPGGTDRTACADEQDAVLLFLGGPLDGRVQIREARHGAPPPTVTHVHLHDGPKVVHHYDLHPLTDQAGVYHLRSRAG